MKRYAVDVHVRFACDTEEEARAIGEIYRSVGHSVATAGFEGRVRCQLLEANDREAEGATVSRDLN